MPTRPQALSAVGMTPCLPELAEFHLHYLVVQGFSEQHIDNAQLLWPRQFVGHTCEMDVALAQA